MENIEADTTQRIYARLAGILFLGVILIALVGGSILSRVAGNGTFAEKSARIAASERLYRVGLCTVLIATLSSTLLAFALYATLRPVNRLLAQLAMIFSLEDSFLALMVRMSGFVRVHLYVSAQANQEITGQQPVDLLRMMGGTMENLGGICFGIGSGLFFYLFLKSRYIPKPLAALGMCASLVWAGLYCAKLIFPEYDALFQNIYLPPMALADIGTGLCLALFAVKAPTTASHAALR